MAYRMACEYAKSVSALVSIAGATFFHDEDCLPDAPVHVLQIHGTWDENVSYKGGELWCGGLFPSAEQTVEKWASYNSCRMPPEVLVDLFDLDSSLEGPETRITRYAEECRGGGSAELWSIEHGKHTPDLNDQARTLIVEHLLSRSGCSGQETLKKIKCTANGKLITRLRRGMPLDSYSLELTDEGWAASGQLNRRGHAKIKLTGMQPGQGTAVASWGCGAKARRSYRCP